jgi:hypothetical protein
VTLVDERELAPAEAPADKGGRRGNGWFTTICALVALAAGAIGLFWDFAPQFRPDPLEVIGADVAIVAVEPQVPLETWLGRARPDDSAGAARQLFGREPSKSELAQKGNVVYVRIQVDGHKHKNVSLSYRVFDGRSHEAFDPPGLPEPAASNIRRVQLNAPSERSVQLLWLPSLEGEPHAFIRVELTSDRGLLAIGESGTLRNGVLGR